MLENAWNICKEMLELRGYTIMTEDFEERNMVAIDSSNNSIYVYFVNSPKLNIKLVKYYYYLINTLNIKHCIIVYHDSITFTVRTTLSSLYGVQVELFMLRELQFNITKHVLVPKHTKIQKTSGEDYTKYPVIKPTDAVARFMGFRAGDLIQVDRSDGTISYRYCK